MPEDFNVDELIEVDPDFIEGLRPANDNDEEDTLNPSASSSSSLKHRATMAAKRKLHRRPAGKTSNDPVTDIMQVSDDDEFSDDDL